MRHRPAVFFDRRWRWRQRAVVLLNIAMLMAPLLGPRECRSQTSSALTRPMAAAASRFTAADFERHVERLKEKLPSDDFTVVVEPPFVVIGDEPAARVKRGRKIR